MIKPSYLGSGIIIGGAILGFYLLTKETRIDKLKRETNKEAVNIIISAFVEMLLDNPTIDIESAILKFENADEGLTLCEFAESKTRIKKNYVDAYQKYFNKALDVVNFK